MNPALLIRGETVHRAPPPGTIPVAGPYRPGTEDWLLFRVVNDFRRVGAEPVFVQEKAAEIAGGFWGVAIYRRGVAPARPGTITDASQADEETAHQADAPTTAPATPEVVPCAPDGRLPRKKARAA